jgi:dynein heavy chain
MSDINLETSQIPGLNIEASIQENTDVHETPRTQVSDADLQAKIQDAESKLDFGKLQGRFLSAMVLHGFQPSELSTDHYGLIREFLTIPQSNKLLIYIDKNKAGGKLCVTTSLASTAHEEMMYFIKENGEYQLSESNFESKVQHGRMSKHTMESLHQLMAKVYVPIFLGNKKWPDSVRKEFNNHLHKFMVSFL